MRIDKVQNVWAFDAGRVKEKSGSSDEFWADLNAIKNEKNDKKSKFVNEDLDLGELRSDFNLYAWQKLRESQHKKNEETLLGQLFSLIDKNNAPRP